MQEEDAQHRTLLRVPELNLRPVIEHLERPEYPKLH
jgi:hypothetical protein